MRKYQHVNFDIPAFDHGSFFLLWNAVVELLYVVTLATGMRGISGNEQSQDVSQYIVLPSTPSGSQHYVTGLNKFTSPLFLVSSWCRALVDKLKVKIFVPFVKPTGVFMSKTPVNPSDTCIIQFRRLHFPLRLPFVNQPGTKSVP